MKPRGHTGDKAGVEPGRKFALILEDIGSLLLRLTIGILFLMGAWASGKNRSALRFTVGETALVFKAWPQVFAVIGIFIMGAGGLSVLFGGLPRLGALGLTIFLLFGGMIHLAKRAQAEAYKQALLPALGTNAAARGTLDELTTTAAIGHFVSALKNFALMGPTAYLVLAGAREPLLIGLDSDWQWAGLLV
jgi:uncharacterized membrane protein YphA (DoxX/SURF4 family)